jgi:hypothetical protein
LDLKQLRTDTTEGKAPLPHGKQTFMVMRSGDDTTRLSVIHGGMYTISADNLVQFLQDIASQESLEVVFVKWSN